MGTYMTLTRVDRHTANQMAGEAANHNGTWFQEQYGAPWLIRYAHSCIAAFVKARMKELGKKTIDEYHEIISMEYIKEMFKLNEIDVAWPGDTTAQMSIDTFLVAFIYDGSQPEEDDEKELETKDGYEIIDKEYCKYHSTYKHWKLYRAWNVVEGHGKMKYYALQYSKILRAKNLGGIKDQVNKSLKE